MTPMVGPDDDAELRTGPPAHVYVGIAAFLVLLANWMREFLSHHPSGITIALVAIGVVAFAAVFFRIVQTDIPGRFFQPDRTGLVVLLAGIAMVLAIVNPVPDALLLITVGAIAAAFLPRRRAILGIGLATLGVIGVHVGHGSVASETARDVIQSVAICFFVLGYARLSETTQALREAREQVAGLAVANE